MKINGIKKKSAKGQVVKNTLKIQLIQEHHAFFTQENQFFMILKKVGNVVEKLYMTGKNLKKLKDVAKECILTKLKL